MHEGLKLHSIILTDLHQQVKKTSSLHFSDRENQNMAHFTLPETKLYTQRMVHNYIQDVLDQKKEDIRKWNLTFEAMYNFDQEMTEANCDILSMCKGSKTPISIGERIKFGILAEKYLRKHLVLLLVTDMPIDEQADVNHEKWKLLNEMKKMDYPKSMELVSKMENITKFKKLGDNDYVVSIHLTQAGKLRSKL